MPRILLLFMSALAWSRDVRAQVIGGSATTNLGDSAILPCLLTRTLEKDETLEQISWQRRTKGKPQRDNFMTITSSGSKFVNGGDNRFQVIGRFADKNGTLQLDNVSLNDEGTYTCIFSVFPSGNFQTDIPLKVLVSPLVSVKDEKPLLGDKEAPLASCLAVGAKPAAEVYWVPGSLGQNTTQKTNTISNPNGTQTTTVTLYGRPTRDIYGYLVQCVVSSEALMRNKTLNYPIQVYFPPEEVKIAKVSELSFECGTEANPSASFNWSRYGNRLSSSVRVNNAILDFPKKAVELSGLYWCEATNGYGRKNSSLYVDFSPGSPSGWTAFWVLFALNFAAAVVGAVWYFRSGKCPSFPLLRRGQEAVPTDGSPDDAEETNPC